MASEAAKQTSPEKIVGGVGPTIKRYAAWVAANNPSIKAMTVAAREATVRRALKIKKKHPLEYGGLAIRCVGSRSWRNEHQGQGLIA